MHELFQRHIPLQTSPLSHKQKDWWTVFTAARSRTLPPHLFNCQNPPGESFNSFCDEMAIAVKQAGNPLLPDKAFLMNVLSRLTWNSGFPAAWGEAHTYPHSVFMHSHLGTLQTHASYVQGGKRRGDEIRKKWGSAIIALTEGGTNTWRQGRGEKWKKKTRRRKRGVEKAWVAGACSRWAAQDNQSREMSRVPRRLRQPPWSDRWQAWWMAVHCEHSPLRARQACGEGKQRAAGGQRGSRKPGEGEEKEDKGAGGQSGNVFVNEHWEQMFTPGTWVTCLRWSYTNISWRQSSFGSSGDLTGWVKPQQQLQTSESPPQLQFFQSQKMAAIKWPQRWQQVWMRLAKLVLL